MRNTVFFNYLPPNPDEVDLRRGDIFYHRGMENKPHVWTGKKWVELQAKSVTEEQKPSRNDLADILWGLVALIALVFVLALAVVTINHEKSTESHHQNLDSVVQIV